MYLRLLNAGGPLHLYLFMYIKPFVPKPIILVFKSKILSIPAMLILQLILKTELCFESLLASFLSLDISIRGKGNPSGTLDILVLKVPFL